MGSRAQFPGNVAPMVSLLCAGIASKQVSAENGNYLCANR